MKPPPLRSLAPLLALLAFMTVASAPTDAGAAGRYVAFGDSGTTGSGLSTVSSPGSQHLCWQTQNSYPEFVKSALGFSDFATAACSAAWINDFTTTQDLYNGATMQFEDVAQPQFNKLNGAETLITISIGDNDSGYGDIVNTCLDKPSPSTPCQDGSAFHNFVTRANSYLSSPLGEAINEAHRRSPKAEVWVIGYPRLLPEDISNCPGKINVSANDAPIVNAWQKAVNDTEKATAESHGAYYLNVFSMSDGHDACQPNEAVRWVNPSPAATKTGWSFHPTLAGHMAVAQLFVNAFNSPRPIPPTVPNVSTPAEIGQTLKVKIRSKKMRPVRSRVAPITKTRPKKHGAKLYVTLARSGNVRFLIDRAKKGHRKKGKCRWLSKRASKGRKTCTRYVRRSSSVTLSLAGGTSKVYFTGRAGGKRLKAGKYRVRVSLGSLSAKTPKFRIVR